jgi:hypothetical protein
MNETVTIGLERYLNLIGIEKNFISELELRTKENNDKEIIKLKSIIDDYRRRWREIESKNFNLTIDSVGLIDAKYKLEQANLRYYLLEKENERLKNNKWFSKLF